MDNLKGPEREPTPRGLLAQHAREAVFHGVELPEPTLLGGQDLYDLTGSLDLSQGCVCIIGAFDGVHLGHRALIDDACRDARRRGLPVIVVTFSPDPAFVLNPRDPHPMLMGGREHLKALATTGVDAIYVIGFTPGMAATSYPAFIEDALVATINPVSIHVGKDFVIGAGGRGNVESLGVLCTALGIDLYGHELVCEDGAAVTATRIRALVQEGDVAEASRLLGRYPAVEGVVVRGRGEGSGFGFPTANVSCAPHTCLPAEGVFAGLAVLGDVAMPAAITAAPRASPPTRTCPWRPISSATRATCMEKGLR
jgi:riboflavin kinase/FMN adenylyltransferase